MPNAPRSTQSLIIKSAKNIQHFALFGSIWWCKELTGGDELFFGYCEKKCLRKTKKLFSYQFV